MAKIIQRMVGLDTDAWAETSRLKEAGQIVSRASFIREAHVVHLAYFKKYDELDVVGKLTILKHQLLEILHRLEELT